jgi:uncharacterized repeat protein (TIGR01451 family)
VNPRINVEKTANPATIHAGDSVTYNYVVTNPGDVPLANVSVTDDKCSPLVPTGGDTNGNNRLDPGEVWTYRCTTTLAADTLNTVTATGQPTGPSGQPLPGIGPVTDQATALVDVINPAIHVIKSGPATSFKGDTAVFTYAVTNAGDTPLSGVTVTDNVCGTATYLYGDANLDGKLGLGELWAFQCSYVVKPTDPDPLVNTATATGADALGRQVTDQDTWRTDLFTVRFGDFVWLDDGDGVQQPGETTGIAGVKIHVTGLDVLGNTIDITVTTSITGFYMVSNLVPGTYTATVPAVVSTYHLSSVGTRTFTLSQAVQQRLDIDFGYTLPTGLQLLAFDAVPDAASVRLSWEVMLGAGVTEPPQFHVWRSNAGGAWKQLTTDYLAPTAQDGARATYAYTDVQV